MQNLPIFGMESERNSVFYKIMGMKYILKKAELMEGELQNISYCNEHKLAL